MLKLQACLLFGLALCALPAVSVADKRVPAEWERQQAVWLQWPGRYERSFRPAFAQMSTISRRYQPLNILYTANSDQVQASQAITAAGGDPDHARIEWQQLPSDSAWMRDNGPVYVVENDELRIQNWEFNAWGGAFGSDIRFARDNRVPTELGKRLKFRWTALISSMSAVTWNSMVSIRCC